MQTYKEIEKDYFFAIHYVITALDYCPLDNNPTMTVSEMMCKMKDLFDKRTADLYKFIDDRK